MSRSLLIAIVVVYSCLVLTSLTYPQGKSKNKLDVSRYAGSWISNGTDRRPFLPQSLLIIADEERLTIIKKWTTGLTSRSSVVELFVDKRGEKNWETRADEKKVEIKSATSWEDGAIVRRYVRIPEQTTESKMFGSERFKLSKDGKRLLLTYITCPESIWPTNPIQEMKMCFDEKRTFLRGS